MDSVNLVQRTIEKAGRNLGQQLGRMIFDGKLSTIVDITAAVSGSSTVTVPVTDVHSFREMQTVDIYSADLLTKLGSGVVQSVSTDGYSLTSTVALINVKDGAGVAKTSGTFAEDATIWIPGFLSLAAGARFVSLTAAAGSADIYGTAVSGNDWRGIDKTSGAQLGNEQLRQLQMDLLRKGGEATDLLMSPDSFEDFEEAQTDKIRFVPGKLDPYGKHLEHAMFGDARIVVDANCPTNRVFGVNKSTKLGVWKKFQIHGNGKGGVECSQSAYSYLMRTAGAHQLIVERRNHVAMLSLPHD